MPKATTSSEWNADLADAARRIEQIAGLVEQEGYVLRHGIEGIPERPLSDGVEIGLEEAAYRYRDAVTRESGAARPGNTVEYFQASNASKGRQFQFNADMISLGKVTVEPLPTRITDDEISIALPKSLGVKQESIERVNDNHPIKRGEDARRALGYQSLSDSERKVVELQLKWAMQEAKDDGIDSSARWNVATKHVAAARIGSNGNPSDEVMRARGEVQREYLRAALHADDNGAGVLLGLADNDLNLRVLRGEAEVQITQQKAETGLPLSERRLTNSQMEERFAEVFGVPVAKVRSDLNAQAEGPRIADRLEKYSADVAEKYGSDTPEAIIAASAAEQIRDGKTTISLEHSYIPGEKSIEIRHAQAINNLQGITDEMATYGFSVIEGSGKEAQGYKQSERVSQGAGLSAA